MLLIYGKDGTPEVRKSTLWTSYWESIGSQFFKLVFCGNLREREQYAAAHRLYRSQAGFFRRSATVFEISCESTSSDTARASDIAPTRALKVRIALDLAARLSLPGSKPRITSRSSLTCSEVSARVRLSLRAISGARALNAQPVPGFLRCATLK